MQKIDEPIIYEVDGELAFILITEIDLSLMKNKFIFGKGKKYSYEDGYITESEGFYEVSLSLEEEGLRELEGDN